MEMTRVVLIAVLLAGSIVATSEPRAQQPGVRRVDLQRHDLSVAGREVVQVRVELAPGAEFPKHTHPGEEIIYVIEGSLEYQVGANPPATVNAGGVLFIPAGAAHSARNVGKVKGAELATYILEKGKPALSVIQ
jgi:quercetin dioxygenase-like cupin family protein